MKKNNEEKKEAEKKTDDKGIRIVSSDDKKIKVLGEVLANESSIKILKLLVNSEELTINQISQRVELSIPLVSHHIKKMQESGVVKVSKVGTSVKGHKMNYYTATNQSILITPPEKEGNRIVASVRKASKFVAVGLAGIVSWGMLQPSNPSPIQSSQVETIHEESPKWDAAYQDFSEVDEFTSEQMEQTAPVASEPMEPAEPTSDAVPVMEPDVEHESPERIDDQSLQMRDSESAYTGSIDLDSTQYTSSGVESMDPLLLSIIIPISVVAGGLILERILTRWYQKRMERTL